jgi:hypothetical protein
MSSSLLFLTTRGLPAQAWRRACGVALASAALLWGCGGGVGSGGTGGFADAGGFASGPITGFGSVIVNEVRFDDSSAVISDADGNSRSRDQLRLGMTVEVESGAITTTAAGTATAIASRIKLQSELRGPVSAVQLAAGTFTVLGQVVTVDSTTLFDDNLTRGLASLSGPDAPAQVEVYAVFDASTGRYRALRVDAADAAAGLRLRGPVQQIDAASQTVRIGGASYALTAAAQPPGGLAVGQIVSLQVQAPAAGSALQVKSWGSTVQPVADTDQVKLKGVVSAYSSRTSFSVNGREVDASSASFSPSGSTLGLGVRLEVEGPVRGGVLRATKVAVKSESDDFDKGFDLSGVITAVTPTAIPGQPLIVVRGQTISTASADLRYENGTASALTVGRSVEVKGVLAADRRTVEAKRIKF